jgi:hypothetical protein
VTDDVKTTYHALFDDDGVPSILVRLRMTNGSLFGETYRPNEGWVASNYAFDIMVNGQDYDLLNAAEAADAAAAIDRAEQHDPHT